MCIRDRELLQHQLGRGAGLLAELGEARDVDARAVRKQLEPRLEGEVAVLPCRHRGRVVGGREVTRRPRP
eukprot:8754034-Alexandrium_andersonii.AAC.1